MKITLYEAGFIDAENGEEPFSDLSDEYMRGYNAGLIAQAFR